jgi:transcriptional regulator with XRE-family HTH domain
VPRKKREERISMNDITDDYFNVLHRAHEQMNEVFDRLHREEGLTQDQVAQRLGVNKSLVSRRLHGEENQTLRSMSAMATGMRCVLNISFTPYKDMASVRAGTVASDGAIGAETNSARLTLLSTKPIQDEPDALKTRASVSANANVATNVASGSSRVHQHVRQINIAA